MTQTARKVVLLDLDGTLTSSHPGILASVAKVFEELDLPIPDEAALRRFIGPSIAVSLRRNHVPESRIQHGVQIYRHYYAAVDAFPDPSNPNARVPGCLYASVFPGIIDQMDVMRKQGFILAVATCKPEYQAIPVCDHFGLTNHLDAIYGASTDARRATKDKVIAYAFEGLGFSPERGDKALMVGDRWTDADGARRMGLDCLGCGWGYAEPDELKNHGAYRIIDRIDQLSEAVGEYFA